MYPEVFTFAIISLSFIVSSCWTLVQALPVIENRVVLSTEVAVVCRGAAALQTVFVAGEALAGVFVLVELLGTGLMAHILV